MIYNNKVRIITIQDLVEAGCFDVPASLGVIETTLVKEGDNDVIFPDKVSVIFDDCTQNRINCLPAGIKSQNVYGMKWVSVFPENPHTYQLPNLSAVIILSNLTNGFPVAFMEGTLCSNLRTAAVGAIAAKYLAKKKQRL